MSTPSFASLENALHAQAQAAAQLDNFGDPEYRAGLRELLAALDDGQHYSEMGRQFAMGIIVGTLIARLHTEEGWRRRPDCLQNKIVRPLVITGIPRTGTTALHKLLAMDPQFQGMEHWLGETPMPRPARATWQANKYFLASVQGLEMFFQIMPEMRKAHDIVADEVDECLEILRQSFVSNRFASGMRTPRYARWLDQQDERASYRRYANVLRLIGADQPNQRWLLKNPGHIATLDCLLEVFPDAMIVQTHRDPVQALPSLCSTLHMAWRMFEGDAAPAAEIGAREVDYWGRAVDAADLVRSQLEKSGRGNQVFDMHHRRFHADPLGTVRAIYRHFDLSLSQAAEDRMRAWIAASPTTKHGEHRYELTDYGITAQGIRERFARYVRHHGIC